MTKFIIITGGVVSSIGKGITTASIGRLLKHYNYNVGAVKIDPYLNYDSGTLNPYQHGEVFVTYDGMETDLDIGHYERFLDIELTGDSNITTGKIYKNIIDKEREGGYLGECVQVVPHVTDTVKEHLFKVADEGNYDVVMVELGGTVGDIESEAYLEALRQLRNELPCCDTFFIHTVYVPYLEAAKEYKTKPTQHSVQTLRGKGINPDMLIVRSKKDLDNELLEKISKRCGVNRNAVISLSNMEDIYYIPHYLSNYNVEEVLGEKLGLELSKTVDDGWFKPKKIVSYDGTVKIGIVGKYTEYEDSYISIREALQHAAENLNIDLEIKYVNSEYYSDNQLYDVDGVLVPGGFGARGIQGKLDSIRYCRVNDVPCFGICLGMQLMVVDFARDHGMFGANSSEFNPQTEYSVINLMGSQRKIQTLGGTMRLGNYHCRIIEDTLASESYMEDDVYERHRHRYEFNNDYKKTLTQKGLVISGLNPKTELAEIIEDPKLTYYLGCQFHPEYKSRPNNPHPLFTSFIHASYQKKEEEEEKTDVKK